MILSENLISQKEKNINSDKGLKFKIIPNTKKNAWRNIPLFQRLTDRVSETKIGEKTYQTGKTKRTSNRKETYLVNGQNG